LSNPSLLKKYRYVEDLGFDRPFTREFWATEFRKGRARLQLESN